MKRLILAATLLFAMFTGCADNALSTAKQPTDSDDDGGMRLYSVEVTITEADYDGMILQKRVLDTIPGYVYIDGWIEMYGDKRSVGSLTKTHRTNGIDDIHLDGWYYMCGDPEREKLGCKLTVIYTIL